VSGIRIAVTIIYLIVCAILGFLVFRGKGEGADLTGAVSTRVNDTYFTTHGKKHTEDAVRERATVIFSIIFLAMSIILNMGWGY